MNTLPFLSDDRVRYVGNSDKVLMHLGRIRAFSGRVVTHVRATDKYVVQFTGHTDDGLTEEDTTAFLLSAESLVRFNHREPFEVS